MQSENDTNTEPTRCISDICNIVRNDGVRIVIGRQYGCGGRMLGRMLAQRLGVTYYDKELLAEASARLGLDPEVLERIDERKPSLIRSIFTVGFGAACADYSVSSMNAETLYGAQSDVIRQLGMEGPCVFVGRTADYILRDLPGMFSIFLHADIDSRARRICDRMGNDDMAKAAETAMQHDRKRREYYNYFTGRDWGMASNYDLCIDTSGISMESIADTVLTYIAGRLV